MSAIPRIVVSEHASEQAWVRSRLSTGDVEHEVGEALAAGSVSHGRGGRSIASGRHGGRYVLAVGPSMITVVTTLPPTRRDFVGSQGATAIEQAFLRAQEHAA